LLADSEDPLLQFNVNPVNAGVAATRTCAEELHVTESSSNVAIITGGFAPTYAFTNVSATVPLADGLLPLFKIITPAMSVDPPSRAEVPPVPKPVALTDGQRPPTAFNVVFTRVNVSARSNRFPALVSDAAAPLVG